MIFYMNITYKVWTYHGGFVIEYVPIAVIIITVTFEKTAIELCDKQIKFYSYQQGSGEICVEEFEIIHSLEINAPLLWKMQNSYWEKATPTENGGKKYE